MHIGNGVYSVRVQIRGFILEKLLREKNYEYLVGSRGSDAHPKNQKTSLFPACSSCGLCDPERSFCTDYRVLLKSKSSTYFLSMNEQRTCMKKANTDWRKSSGTVCSIQISKVNLFIKWYNHAHKPSEAAKPYMYTLRSKPTEL